jgi:hypothetical protein
MAIVSLCGWLVSRRWPNNEIRGLLLPLIHANFIDFVGDDWSAEVENAIKHARNCEQKGAEALLANLAPKPDFVARRDRVARATAAFTGRRP